MNNQIMMMIVVESPSNKLHPKDNNNLSTFEEEKIEYFAKDYDTRLKRLPNS